MNQRRFLGLGISILGVLIFSPALVGQVSKESEAAFPTDWSNHHLIFSKPATAEQAQRVQQDPRYWQQIARQSPATLRETETDGALVPELQLGSKALLGENQKISKDWSQDLGGGASVGAANYPAKYPFRPTNANCAGGSVQPDFVVYGTGIAGSSTQATIVAYDNLYSGCSSDGSVPTVYWAYDTLGGTVTTSPVLSGEGTQVAFVQLGSGSPGPEYPSTLVLLKWAESGSEKVGSPGVLKGVLRSSYQGCTAPCTTSIPLRGGGGRAEEDSNSSVFYDYGQDTAYVGDNAGWLHKFNPVFHGEPGEVRTGGWPVRVNKGSPTALTSPVFDYASGNVFVADTGGFLYLVDSTGGVTQSGQLDFSSDNDSGPGIVQGPIVDSTAGLVYVFATSDGSGSCTGGSDCTAVYQLPTNFAAGDTGLEAEVGASTVEPTTPNPLYIGAFNTTYENSVNATGDLYVCGNTGGPPILYQVSIGDGVLGTVTAGPVLSDDTTPCSPVTDILNPNASGGATEWMFASVEGGGVSTACDSEGCVFNFKDTPWLPSNAYVVGQEIVDSNFHIEFVVSATGPSGTSPPFWSIGTGSTTTDHDVKWLNVGPLSAFPPAVWVKLKHYSKGAEILDGSNNIELATTGGTSGNAVTFNPTVGGTTDDGTVIWTNVGLPPTAALAATGGTSGIIMDNTVGSLAGASQIYFSTLSGGCGGTNDTDGCAVQASQPALQ
ncbi:MAG: hypothetical protein WCA20_21970 [Candidatus Sulfotelmatobacter sp.]